MAQNFQSWVAQVKLQNKSIKRLTSKYCHNISSQSSVVGSSPNVCQEPMKHSHIGESQIDYVEQNKLKTKYYMICMFFNKTKLFVFIEVKVIIIPKVSQGFCWQTGTKGISRVLTSFYLLLWYDCTDINMH